MLHFATAYNTHSVIRIRFIGNGFEIGWNPEIPGYHALLSQYPYLKFRHGTETQPVGSLQMILTNSTKQLHRFLQTAGTNETFFKFNGRFERSGSN
jgi:hypothetical protein